MSQSFLFSFFIVNSEMFDFCDMLVLLNVTVIFCPVGLRHVMYIVRFAEANEIEKKQP